MIFYVDRNVTCDFSFAPEEIGEQVAECILEREGCPYETAVSLLITDDKGIREMNRQFRGMEPPALLFH